MLKKKSKKKYQKLTTPKKLERCGRLFWDNMQHPYFQVWDLGLKNHMFTVHVKVLVTVGVVSIKGVEGKEVASLAYI